MVLKNTVSRIRGLFTGISLHRSYTSRSSGAGRAAWPTWAPWSGGSYGVGQRLAIAHTRALVHAALDGSLSKVPMATEPLFGLAVPSECPGVPVEILTPRNTWSDKAAYDAQAKKLAGMFAENFKTFAEQVSSEVRQAGPQPQ
jgi:phosphoenolpyruvate carboxykinase (ATP)